MPPFLGEEIRNKLKPLFERFSSKVIVELFLDASSRSAELSGYISEISSLTDMIDVRIGDAEAEPHKPCVRLLRSDGEPTGIAFHGVPGGHEFTSFALALYNAAGPGQELSAEHERRIGALTAPAEIKIFVTLSCSLCPDTVTAAQRIAAAASVVSAEAYDLAAFPQMRKDLRIMSVPCVTINGGEPMFGRKDMSGLLDDLETAERAHADRG